MGESFHRTPLWPHGANGEVERLVTSVESRADPSHRSGKYVPTAGFFSQSSMLRLRLGVPRLSGYQRPVFSLNLPWDACPLDGKSRYYAR
jgi:hypothetical protein